MSRCQNWVLLAVLMVGCLSSASAGAATGVVTGGPSITGTSGTTLLKDHTVGVTLSCTGSSWSGTLAASASGALPLRMGTITAGFSGCKQVGGLGFTIACQPMAIVATSLTAGGHTPLAFTGISCHEYITSQTSCRRTVVGAMGARFQNGTPAAFTVDSNHENLASFNSTNGAGSACAVLPNDSSMRFSNAVNGDPVYTVTPSNLALDVTP